MNGHAHLASALPKHLAWGSNSIVETILITSARKMLRLRGRQMSITVQPLFFLPFAYGHSCCSSSTVAMPKAAPLVVSSQSRRATRRLPSNTAPASKMADTMRT